MFQNHNNLHLLQSKCLKIAILHQNKSTEISTCDCQQKNGRTSDNTNEHTILHTNDIHGRFVEDDGRVIGMAKVKGLKDKYNPDLMVDSGDAFQGLPVSNNSKEKKWPKL